MDFDKIMKMAQEAQAKLMQAQEDLVKVRASAKGRIIAVEIDESLLQPSEKQMVEDLVAAAINDARSKADVAAQASMKDVTGGMQLPPGFKMPF